MSNHLIIYTQGLGSTDYYPIGSGDSADMDGCILDLALYKERVFWFIDAYTSELVGKVSREELEKCS